MKLVVVDASAAVEYLLGSDLGARAAAVIEGRDADLHTPALCDVEVASALRGLLRGRKIQVRRAQAAADDYQALPLTRHGHLALLDRVLEMRDNFSAYDATYLALAEALGARLLTCDQALASAVAAHAPGIELAS